MPAKFIVTSYWQTLVPKQTFLFASEWFHFFINIILALTCVSVATVAWNILFAVVNEETFNCSPLYWSEMKKKVIYTSIALHTPKVNSKSKQRHQKTKWTNITLHGNITKCLFKDTDVFYLFAPVHAILYYRKTYVQDRHPAY